MQYLAQFTNFDLSTVNSLNGIVMKLTSLSLTSFKLPWQLSLTLLGLLTFLMITTRGNHFTTFNDLPSASTAIFFIAGMYLRHIKYFWFFYVLSIVIDLTSSYYRGQFGDCLTTSYPLLAFSYGIMFAVGHYFRPHWNHQWATVNIIKVSLALCVASSLAFFISNGSYYVLSGKFGDLSWAEYIARVDKYFLKSVSKPVFYVATAVAIDWTIHRFFNEKQAKHLAQ